MNRALSMADCCTLCSSHPQPPAGNKSQMATAVTKRAMINHAQKEGYPSLRRLLPWRNRHHCGSVNGHDSTVFAAPHSGRTFVCSKSTMQVSGVDPERKSSRQRQKRVALNMKCAKLPLPPSRTTVDQLLFDRGPM